MASQDEIDELKAKTICFGCVGEEYLSAEIRKQGVRRRCSYCQKVRRSYEIGEMAERISDVFGEHYARTSDEPDSMQRMMLSDRESSYDWERDGEPVVYAIMNSADLPEEAAEDIQVILEDENDDFDSAAMGDETEFSADTYYEEKGSDDRAWQDEWDTFEQSLKTEARFFSRTAASHLASVFGGLLDMNASDGRPLIVAGGPGTHLASLYRERPWPDLSSTIGTWTPADPDSRGASLRIFVESVAVHVIERVDVNTSEHPVHRHRWQRDRPRKF